MFSMDVFFIGMIILIGAISYVLNNKHLLSMLLSLEFIVLGLFFFFLYIYILFFWYNVFVSFLTFGVCEGALGLSILVSMIRTHGNDYFQSFSVL